MAYSKDLRKRIIEAIKSREIKKDRSNTDL